jgi:hypothetical protein
MAGSTENRVRIDEDEKGWKALSLLPSFLSWFDGQDTKI